MTKELVADILIKFGIQTSIDEALDMYNMAKSLNPKTIVEIGVSDGGSLMLWSKMLGTDGLLIGVDAHKIIKWDIEDTACTTKLIIGNTLDDATEKDVLQALGDRQIDFLRIDGGHDYITVKNDFDRYSLFVRYGGIIAFHDYYQSKEVKKFVDELGEKYKVNYIYSPGYFDGNPDTAWIVYVNK